MREYLRDIVKCVRCGRCRMVCPVQKVSGWESMGPRGRMLMALGLTSGLTPSPGTIKGFLSCTTCHQCTRECPSGADPLALTQAARGKLVLQGHAAPHQMIIEERIRRTGNSLGEDSPRISWISENPVLFNSEYVFFTGCLLSYRQQGTAVSSYEILKRFGVTMLKDERCCGSPLIRLGLDASELIDHNSQQIRDTGAHTVIAGCAGCYSALRDNYQGFRVVHLSEFLAERLGQLPLGGLDIRVAYHDPCHLGRAYGIFDAPRKVIKEVCELVEMPGSREKAKCCGGGGGVKLGYPELSASISKELSMDIPIGIDYLITSCPMCFKNLSDSGIKVLDLADLAWMSLG